MIPQQNVALHGEPAASRFRSGLAALRINGTSIDYREAEGGLFRLEMGHNNLHVHPPVAVYEGRETSYAALGLSIVEIDDKSACTAYHIPQGTLLIYDPLDRSRPQSRTQISTLDVAPALLRNYGINRPDYMRPPTPLVQSPLVYDAAGKTGRSAA